MTRHFLQEHVCRFDQAWHRNTEYQVETFKNTCWTNRQQTNIITAGRITPASHPFVCDVVHRWTSWWNNNNVSLVYQQVSKTKMKWNHRLYVEKPEKLSVLLAGTLFSAFYYHLCCFDVAARRQTFDEYPLFWYEKIDSHERDMRTREHRAVCASKR